MKYIVVMVNDLSWDVIECQPGTIVAIIVANCKKKEHAVRIAGLLTEHGMRVL